MNIGPMSAAFAFALSIPIVMQYRILPVEGTPYWLFGILFFVLIANVFGQLYLPKQSVIRRYSVPMWLILIIVVVLPVWTAVADRHRIAPIWQVHDIILQQEAAIRYFVNGKNPYKETYFGTPVEGFRYDELGKPAINPALYHFVMPPWYLLSPLPFYVIANRTIGYFDGRIPLLATMIGTCLVLFYWFKNQTLKELAVIITALSPATVNYFIEGRSDIYALFWLVSSLFLLDKRKYFWSSVFIVLGALTKQTIWFAVPFWGVLLWVSVVGKKPLRKITYSNVLKIVPYVSTVGILTLAVVLPFIIWDARAFFESVVLYLSAGGETGYPVSGYGFSMILFSAGIIKNLHDYYPFLLWQAVLGVPLLFMLIKWVLKKTIMSRWLISYALFLAVIWYFSRYFNNSHIAFISSIFILGILKHIDESEIETA